MPKEAFLIKNEVLSSFTVSTNLRTKESDFSYINKYLETNNNEFIDPEADIVFDKDFFHDTSVYYIGSHNSWYMKNGDPANAFHVWILE